MGVTFECDYPEEARTRRIVSTSAMPEGLTPAEIDAFVVAAMANGDDLYHLDEGALAGLDADLVVTQDLCAVCAVDVSVVDDALAHLGCTAEVLTIDPYTLDEVFASIETLGKATGHEGEADRPGAVPAAAAGRAVRRWSVSRRKPRVMFLEWTDPPFAPGHWIPEMVEARRRRSRCWARQARSRGASRGTTCTRPGPTWWSSRRAATTARAASRSPTTWWRAACCRPAYRSTPSTPTPPGPGPAPGWSTVSRSWPGSCTPDEVLTGDGLRYRQGQWPHDRAPAQGRRAHGATRGAPAGVRRPDGARARQAAGRPVGRVGADRGPAAHGRAAVPDPGRAQGRGDEVRPGAVGARGRAAGRAGGALPRAPDGAPGLGAADARGHGLRGDRGRARPGLARPAGPDGREGGRRRVDRPGAPRALARRPRGGGQGAVPRRRRRAARRPAADRAGGEGDGAGLPRHRHQAAGRGGPGPRGRRARLPPRGRGPGGVRRGLPRRPRDRGARRRRGRRHRAGQRVDGVERLAGLDHREGHPRGARPLRPAAGPVPVRRPRAHRHAARRPAPRELPDPAERRRQPGPAGRARLRRRRPPPRAGRCRPRWAG